MMILNDIKDTLHTFKIQTKNFIRYEKHRERLDGGICDIAMMGTPSYGNMGDQLIALAQLWFLKNSYPEKKICEISENDVRYDMRSVRRHIGADTVIFLQGGGNISDVWTDQEKIRKRIIDAFPKNRIVVMPQTVFIKDESAAREILKKYKGVRVCAREERSYGILAKYGIETCLCPDITLSLGDYCAGLRESHERSGVAVCIRDDAETADVSLRENIEKHLEQSGVCYETFSTVVPEYITKSAREGELGKMLSYISGKQLVITDRLHAMIMAYLTDTPCIAFANSNGKLEGTYRWISDAQNVYFAKSGEEGLKEIERLMNLHNSEEFKHNEAFLQITAGCRKE